MKRSADAFSVGSARDVIGTNPWATSADVGFRLIQALLGERSFGEKLLNFNRLDAVRARERDLMRVMIENSLFGKRGSDA
jgi:hypothetical protein